MKFWIFATGSFIVGAIVGSFLNVCIYRLPRGLSLYRPRRSFCPTCRSSLKGKELVPILSWLVLGRHCSRCHTSISFRYPLVELLTGLLFAVFQIIFPQAWGFWVLVSLLVVATFIDLETLTIPNSVTWGGVLAGTGLSFVFPSSLEIASATAGLLTALSGAMTGYLLLWGVLEVGKWAFGKIRLGWDSPREFCFSYKGESSLFECAGEIWRGEEMFVRKNDELMIETDFWKLSDDVKGSGVIRLRKGYLLNSQGNTPINEGQKILGSATSVSIPREAMGWGDVKFLAAIGAFIGVPGVLFTLFFASLFGALIGACILLFRQCHEGMPIPFGPFLAMGTLAWIFGGQTLWNIYFSRFGI